MTDTLPRTGPDSLGAGPGRNPRAVITGVTPVQKRLFECSRGGASEFDWYASTVMCSPDDLLDGLASNLGGEVREGSALHGYTNGFEIHTPEGVAARVLAGGKNGAPHAWASGADSAAFVDVVRALWPGEHRVSRMDSRIDFNDGTDDESAWDALFKMCVRLADKSGLKTSLAGDYLGKSGGRTLYVGSKKSGVFVRLYEKGKQLRAATRDGQEAARVPLGWVRLEVQCRPKDDARWMAASATPEEAWGYSKWTKKLAREVAGLDVPQVTMQVKRETDDERALAWVARQYGGTFERLADLHGWQTVFDLLAIQIAKNQGLTPPK